MNHRKIHYPGEGHGRAKLQNSVQDFVLKDVHLNARKLICLICHQKLQATYSNLLIMAYSNQKVNISQRFCVLPQMPKHLKDLC